MPAPPPAVPSWYGDRDINFAEVTKATDIPTDTLVGWHRLLQAAELDVGRKIRREWMFSCRELVAFHIAAALSRLRLPVGAGVLRQVFQHVSDGKEREHPFMMMTADMAAAVTVHCPMLFTAAVQMMEKVRELEDAE